MQLSGWGRYPKIEARLQEPPGVREIAKLLKTTSTPCIPRGAGRSYGDSALAEVAISSRYLDNFIEFNTDSMLLHCATGLTLSAVLQVTVPHGAFLPVLPGTKFVTVGGAIAADIHGKNHHVDGSFCDYVEELSLLLANGDLMVCSRSENTDIFSATCGGMGLTGLIVAAKLRLVPIAGPFIRSRTLRAEHLKMCLELFEEHKSSKYSVAWIDCLATGDKLGRGLLHLGETLLREWRRPKPDGKWELWHFNSFLLASFFLEQTHNWSLQSILLFCWWCR